MAKTATMTPEVEETSTSASNGAGGAGPKAVSDFEVPKFEVVDSGSIDPRELVIDPMTNGRRYPSDVESMARSLLSNGQLQPIVVRKLGGALHVVFGFRRALGALYILEHGLAESFEVRYDVVAMTEEEAFIHNLVENTSRVDTSVVEDATNWLKLTQEPYNLTQKAIASKLDISDAQVSRALSLVRGNKDFPALSAKILKLVHLKKIAVESAYNLVNMTTEKRDAYVEKLLHGKASSADTKQASESKAKRKGATGGEGGRALSSKAIRLPFEEIVTKHDPEEEMTPFVQVCEVVTRMCLGKVKAATGLKKIKELVEG